MNGASAHLAHDTYHHDCSIRMVHGEGGIRNDTNTITLNCLDIYGMVVVDSEHGQTCDRSTILDFELITNLFENCRYSINRYNHTKTDLTIHNFLMSIFCRDDPDVRVIRFRQVSRPPTGTAAHRDSICLNLNYLSM